MTNVNHKRRHKTRTIPNVFTFISAKLVLTVPTGWSPSLSSLWTPGLPQSGLLWCAMFLYYFDLIFLVTAQILLGRMETGNEAQQPMKKKKKKRHASFASLLKGRLFASDLHECCLMPTANKE